MQKVSSTPPQQEFVGATNSDLAFSGNYAIQGNYDGVQATMELHAAAFADTLAMCRDLKVADALPAAVMANFERAIDAGYGQMDLPAVFEVLINSDS